MRNAVEDLPRWLDADVGFVQTLGLHPLRAVGSGHDQLHRALVNHAIPMTALAVAGRAIDGEALLAATHQVHRERDLLGQRRRPLRSRAAGDRAIREML